MSEHTVLMTKKIAPRFVAEAKEQDVDIREIEFIEIEPCDEKEAVKQAAAQPAVVVFTSKNSVCIVAEQLEGSKPDWTIFCIDGATRAEVTKYFGEAAIAGTALTAKALAKLIAQKKVETEVVFFCGDKRREELPETLEDHGVDVNEVVVYETKLLPEEVGEHFDGIGFFSPSAVESFFTANVVDDRTVFFAVGPTTAGCLKKFAKNEIITCERPSEECMVETILRYIKSKNE